MKPFSLLRAVVVSTTLVLAAVITLTAVACGSGDEPAAPRTTTSPDTAAGPDTPSDLDGTDIPSTDSTAPTETEPVALAMSQVPRTSASAAAQEVKSGAAVMEAFGADLYGVLARDDTGANLVFSPASIMTALAMTYAGAAGTTAEEMAAALHFVLPEDALHRAFNSLDSLIESRSWEGEDHEGKDVGMLVRSANSLWGQQDLAFERPFLDTLAGNYGAGIRLVDFKTAADTARRAINDWVSTETAEKIPELIPQGALDTLTRLVLVNAIYLDATWASQFDPDRTQDGTFFTLDGDTVTTPMMRQSTSFAYGKGDGWQAVELPYLHNELAMLLVVPDQGRFAEVEEQLAGGLIGEAAAGLVEGVEVNLSMPKFEFRTQAELTDPLSTLGIRAAFDLRTADFSRMTTDDDLFISDVIHEAFIAVDEEGTEAAAATAVVMRTASAPLEIVDLTIDRPFLFALRDMETGAIIFLGRVTDPTA